MYLINLLTSNDISGTSLYNLIWETYDAPYTCANLRIHIVMKEKTMHDLRCIRCLRCKFKVEIFFFINLLFKVYRYTNYTRKQKFPFSKGEQLLIVLNWHNIFHIYVYTVKYIALEVLTLDVEGEIRITQLAGIGWAQSNQRLKYANIQCVQIDRWTWLWHIKLSERMSVTMITIVD